MTDEFLRQWGQNIKLLREALDAEGTPIPIGVVRPSMTQEQLGSRLDPPVSQSTVARWESGSMEPRRQYKAQLAAVLRTDIRLLFAMTRQGVA